MIRQLSSVVFGFILSTNIMAVELNKNIPTPILPSGPVDIGSIFQVIAALLLIIILIISLSWLYKKYGNNYSMNNKNLKVISALSLGGKEKVVLLQVGEEQILLGISPGFVRKVHCLESLIRNDTEENNNTFISNLNNEIRKVIRK